MHYYIDGYNLLFRILHAGDNLQKQRRELIEDLEAKCHFLELDATLVFDSHYQPDDGSRSHYNNLEICFTALNQTADEFILQALKESSHPAQETVVTSDSHLAWRCRRYLAKTERVEEFMLWLDKRCKNKRRQNKLNAKMLAPKAAQALSKQPNSNSLAPEKKSISEGSFDFYLEVFEKELENSLTETPKITSKEPAEAQSPKKKKKKTTSKSIPEQMETDMQRWMRLFERNPNELE